VTRPHRQRGAAAVELLLVAVGLLAFLAGIMAFGRLTEARTAISGVARESARAAANARTATQAVRLGGEQARVTAAGYGLDPARLQVTVDPHGFARGGTLAVTVRYPVPLDDLPTLRLLPGTVTLTARQVEPIDPYKSR
jgi:Flp pilus assembly protein TadG